MMQKSGELMKLTGRLWRRRYYAISRDERDLLIHSCETYLTIRSNGRHKGSHHLSTRCCGPNGRDMFEHNWDRKKYIQRT